jgi:hypoxanthine phosphoribosyltransferase
LVRIAKDLDEPIHDEDVLLVEDIVDTGFTTRYLLQTLAGRGPRSLGICTLLDRSVRRIVQVPVDFRCFEIPDRFVVGCGLDHKQLYRNLGNIAVRDPERVDLVIPSPNAVPRQFLRDARFLGPLSIFRVGDRQL